MNAAEVKAALTRRHSARDGEWVCIEEAFSGFTSISGGIDLLAIGAWQTAKVQGLPNSGKRDRESVPPAWDATYPIVAYEVKVSRADMRRELYGYRPGPNAKWTTRSAPPWPDKQDDALRQSHYFVFAVPKGLLKDEEVERREPPEDGKGLWLPPEAGLVEVTEGGRCLVRVKAPRRECPPPLPRAQIAELVRHALKPLRTMEAWADSIGAFLAEMDHPAPHHMLIPTQPEADDDP